MRISEFEEKVRIAHGVSVLFSNSMNKTKLKKLIDTIFKTEGTWVDNFEYVIIEEICGDVTGMRQGTDDLIKTRVSFMLDDRNYILYNTREAH